MRATGGNITSGLVHAVLSRRQPVPGTGAPVTWATAVERFARAVHRYHDRVEVIADRALRGELQDVANVLDRALAVVRASGRGQDGEAVRDVLRAGALCSRAIEAAVSAAAARRLGDDDGTARSVAAARSLATGIEELIDDCAASRPQRRRRLP